MAETSRLAKLPGYDTAPDVYETPDLTDDTSTTLPTSPRSPSDSETAASSDEDEEGSHGLSRRHLFPSAARERFARSGRGVDVKAGDFGDRLGVRKGYRVRRRAVGEEDESLEQRIARLRREVEECRVLAKEEGEGQEEAEDGGDILGEAEGLRKVLEGLEGGRPKRQVRRAEPAATLADAEKRQDGDDIHEGTLGKISDFDSRLAVLERSLGLSSMDSTSTDPISTPILPSLTLLDQQLSALMTASSITNLEAASSKIKKLREEAEQISSISPEPSQNGAATGTSTPLSSTASPSLSISDLEKLGNLYSLLPTLQNLSPTVPALLDRLRSLRILHAAAANASEELEDLEKRQGEFDGELKAWKDGLARVESAMKATDEANGRNGKVVQGWVKELEGRIRALGLGRE